MKIFMFSSSKKWKYKFFSKIIKKNRNFVFIKEVFLKRMKDGDFKKVLDYKKKKVI